MLLQPLKIKERNIFFASMQKSEYVINCTKAKRNKFLRFFLAGLLKVYAIAFLSEVAFEFVIFKQL